MTKPFTAYKIIPELGLILNYLSGQLNGDDAIRLKSAEKSDPHFNPQFNYIVDFRDTEIDWTDEMDRSLSRLISFMQNEKTIISPRKSALLTSNPHHVVLTHHFMEYSAPLPMNFKVFSTLETAMKFVDVSLDQYQFIHDEIEKLKTKI